MPAIEVGRICAKTAGREAGKKCVILDVLDKSFVLITGPKKVTGVKRKRANVNHLRIFDDKLEINKGASDDEVTQTIEASGKRQDMEQPAIFTA